MNDNKLLLFGGNISGAATTSQPGIFLGRNRSFNAVGRVGGDVTGAGASLTFTLEESDVLGSGYAQIPGTGTITLTEMIGVNTTTLAPEVPGLPPVRAPFNTTKNFVRITTIAGGTTPVFPGTTVYADPIDNPMKPSGS